MEVERGADADEHAARQPRAHRGHPLLLLRDADPDPHDLGAGPLDVGDDVDRLGLRERAERRCVAADDLQARVAEPQVAGELHERAVVAAAVQVHAPAGARCPLAGAIHQVGAVHAVVDLVAECLERPHQRLAVGNDEVGAENGRAQLGIVLAAITRCVADAQT